MGDQSRTGDHHPARIPVLVRPMRAEEVDAALDAHATVAAEGRWLGTEAGFDRAARRAQWLASLEDVAGRTLVVVDAGTGRLLGHGRVQGARYGVADLGMSVVADARGRGVGGALLDALLEVARDLGAHKAALQVWPHNERAIRLYLSRGFVVEGRIRRHYRRSSGQRWDAILMGLSLDPEGDAPGPALPDGTALPDAACLPAELRIRD
ncbi:MAG TPA: GNAT family N-acetyltransferase [Candidatus Nanopelagicales bacterium]